MAYTTIDNPELYFQTKIYTGQSSDLAVTFDGSENMQPDWVWIKNRDSTPSHMLNDSVRGAGKQLNSDNTSAELDRTYFKSFDSNGFSVEHSVSDYNSNGVNYVSWNWKAGTSFTNDASATGIGTIDSAGSVNTNAGFSICTWTGTGSTNGTIKHGLNTTPAFIIQRRRDGDSWFTWHQKLSTTAKYVLLNTTAGEADGSTSIWTGSPNANTFGIGNNTAVNESGGNYLAYCFNEVKGYSKFGSYTGNGNADGTFVYTGFKPAFVMTKKTSSSTARNWCILDNKRSSSGANVVDDRLFPNLADAEDSSTSADFLSNGFKLRDNAGEFNQAVSYIFMAFAESPFVNSKGVPTNAR